MHEKIVEALKDGVARSHTPGAVVCVGDRNGIVVLEACGFRELEPQQFPAERSTPYDLASLTKVVATTTSVLLLNEAGVLDLDMPIREILPISAFTFTIRQCLTHSTGLVAGLPYYENATSLLEMLERYSKVERGWEAGTRRRYSDVGFMILAKVVEMASGDSLDSFATHRIFKPLNMKRTAFNPPQSWANTCAATENCMWRGGIVLGRVHDENSCAVGGVSGHAGLFSTGEDLSIFCRAFLSNRILKETTVAEILRPGQVPSYPWQGLGWKINPWPCSIEGYLPSRKAMGHTGWTGTSIWMDYDSGVFCILLSNTCHPSREKRNSTVLRQTIHKAVATDMLPGRMNMHTGLDRVVWDGFETVREKRLALLTNHTAIDVMGRHILDVFALDPRVNTRVVYTPEHGLKGVNEAGELIGPQQGTTGVNVVSLYGTQKAPTAAELSGIDLFVVDLQDVGSRWYTYMATMLACMRACADAGKPMLVLDRPNPVGGEVLEGPVASETGSLVCCAPIPARHGMTMGELALFFKARLLGGRKLDLQVSQLDDWRRDRLFAECALPWVPPSPNIPTPETALLYTGMCLFEATTVSEGRGTDTPFQLVGAPWLDAEKVIGNVAAEDRVGCTLTAAAFTPRSIPAKASNPRYRDQVCQGIQIKVTDPHAARPFRLALALIQAMRKVHPSEFGFDKGFDQLAGGPQLRVALEKGVTAAELIAGWTSALVEFDRARPKLY